MDPAGTPMGQSEARAHPHPAQNHPLWTGPNLWELLFWVLVIVAHLGFMVFAAWRLAVKYTEASGTNITIIEPAPPSSSRGKKEEEELPLLAESATGIVQGPDNGTKKRRPLHA